MPPKKLQGKDSLGRARSITRSEDGSYLYDERGRITHVRLRRVIDGKLREKKRTVRSGTLAEARTIKQQLEAEFYTPPPDTSDKTFLALCDYYAEHYLKPAEYQGRTRVAGLRSWQSTYYHVESLKAFLGDTKLRDITRGKILALKNHLAAKPRSHDRYRHHSARRPRSHATINRELEILRRMLRRALALGWLDSDPFAVRSDVPLINSADEIERTRILTYSEEARLLNLCTGARRDLAVRIICALETGMREGEMRQFRFCDVDLTKRIITLQWHTTKDNRERLIPITNRLLPLLAEVITHAMRDIHFDANAPVLPGETKRAWTAIRREAGLTDVRWHDLRHTAITRMVRSGVPHSLIMKVSGHRQMKTFNRYVNLDTEVAAEIAHSLDRFNAAQRPHDLPLSRLAPTE